MITAIPYILITLIFIIYVKKKHQSYVERKYKFRMHKLRDDLRRLGASGIIDPNSMIFEYYDDSFSKNIQQSYYLTLPGMYYIYKKHKDEPAINERISYVRAETEKNPHLVKLKAKATKATFEYVIDQEVLYAIAYWVALMIFKLNGFKKKVKLLIDSVYWMPETSGLRPSSC